MIRDFRQRIETIFRQNHFTARLGQKDFRAASNGVAIVNHHNFQPGYFRNYRHADLTNFKYVYVRTN